ncbi:MAG: peptidyl-prolyl cis-trans isomerase [Fimbriimonas ginsengisoli]|uniref:peptidylprolyl isomerase n=1 Tax=Fimbriimonas ginsengisoli TaxID=1005039 RepID=A0A931PTS7_FIMGI|nr:peptidyl-prolyl cis-trans isomerase [Fimbriimonas ginsengisoli]
MTGMALAQVDPTRIVAVVNGDEINGAEYYRKMEYLPGVGRRIANGFAEFPPGFMTLEQLITEHLLFGLAREKGVYPTDPEVQAELRARSEESPRLLDDWLASGQTRGELELLIRYELAQFKLLTFGITITDQEVETHYKEHPAEFTIPKRLTLRSIVVTTEEGKQAVDAALAAGKDFASVARERSEDISRAVGGEFGTLPIGVLPEAVRNALADVKIGKTTGWIAAESLKPQPVGGAPTVPVGGPWVRFLLEAVLPEELQPLTPQLKRNTRKRLMLDRGKGKNDLNKDMAEMRAKAKVDIKQKEFAEAYARYMDAYLKGKGLKSGG